LLLLKSKPCDNNLFFFFFGMNNHVLSIVTA
jgi:hypothetical protein